MNKNPVTLFFDSALSLIASFCFSYYLFSFFREDQISLILASFTFSLATSSLWLRFLGKKSDQKPKDYSYCKDRFIYSLPGDNLQFVYNALKSRYDCKLNSDVITTPNRDVKVCLTYAPFTCQQAIDCALCAKRKTLIITTAVENGAIAHASKVNDLVCIITFDEFAEWMDALGFLPAPKPKPPLKDRLKATFNLLIQEENAKPLFSCGTVILIFSLLTSFKIYYAIVAVFAIIASFIIKIRGVINGKKHS